MKPANDSPPPGAVMPAEGANPVGIDSPGSLVRPGVEVIYSGPLLDWSAVIVTDPVLVVVSVTRANFGANRKFDCFVAVAATTLVSELFTHVIEPSRTGLIGSFGSSRVEETV